MKFFKLIVLTLLFSLFSYAQTDFTGDWKIDWSDENGMAHSLKLTIASDGTYALDMEMDGNVNVKGKYEMDGDKMTIWDTEGEYACGSDKKGVYQVMASATSMTMTRVSDECTERGDPSGVMTFQRLSSVK